MIGIKAIETKYKGYRFRSRLEARWAVFFDVIGIPWEYELEGFDLGDEGWYLPDFWLPEQKYWFECKPESPKPRDFAGIKKYALLASEINHDVIVAGGSPGLTAHYDNGGELLFNVGNLTWIWPRKFASDEEFWLGLQWVKHPTLGYRIGDFFGGCIEMTFCESSRKAWDSEPEHPSILAAYTAARSARFEHGETPMTVKNHTPTEKQIDECLQRHGYAGARYERLCPPGKPYSPSVVLLPDVNVAFHFSPDDPMYRPDGRGGVYPVTPFDVLATYECGGDYAVAMLLAEKRLGKTP